MKHQHRARIDVVAVVVGAIWALVVLTGLACALAFLFHRYIN